MKYRCNAHSVLSFDHDIEEKIIGDPISENENMRDMAAPHGI